MIRSALIALALIIAPATAFAQESGKPIRPSDLEQKPSTPPKPEDTSLDRYRTPFEALTERMIGTASKSVRFDWRKSPVGFALIGSNLLELNNFVTTRYGGMVRKPLGDFMAELAITRANTWGTDSSAKLARTPYRQYGRPARFELDINMSYPVAEGVVTAVPSFIPPAELVFSGTAGFRYSVYPSGFSDSKFADIAKSLANPQLTDREIARLEADRLPGMQIDRARYGLMAGASLDIYLQPGFVLSPRALVSLPVLAPATGSGLGWWWELTLGAGWMF